MKIVLTVGYTSLYLDAPDAETGTLVKLLFGATPVRYDYTANTYRTESDNGEPNLQVQIVRGPPLPALPKEPAPEEPVPEPLREEPGA